MKFIFLFISTVFAFQSFGFDKSIIPEKAKSLGLIKTFDLDESLIENLISGTGFFVSKTLFVTNYHLIQDALILSDSNDGLGQITIAPYSGPQELVFKKVKVVFLSIPDDMAILDISDQNVLSGPQQPVEFSNSSLPLNLKKGEFLFTLGHPFYEVLKVTSQRFVKIDEFRDLDMISVWSRFGNYPGSSGSPLFDKKGNLLGLMHSYSYLTNTLESNICSINGTLGHGISVRKIKENIDYYKTHRSLVSSVDSLVFKPILNIPDLQYYKYFKASLK